MLTFILLFVIQFGELLAASDPCGHALRVVGGAETVITEYPSTAAILDGSNDRYMVQKCGGVIINEKNVLTAAHCFRLGDTISTTPSLYRVRVGSTCAHTGGILNKILTITIHPKWDRNTHDSDIAVVRLVESITYTYTKQPAVFAGPNYHLKDDEPLWAIGWGFITERGPPSEILRHVLVRSVSKKTCQERYDVFKITDNMMCSGWLKGGGRDQCTRDSGSPLYHNGTVVGISSLGAGCGNPSYPAINVWVPSFIGWIASIAGNLRVTQQHKPRSLLRLPFMRRSN